VTAVPRQIEAELARLRTENTRLLRYDNPHTGKGGWVPAVRGGRLKGVRHEKRGYLPLTADVLS
jgi:hypothetical protein